MKKLAVCSALFLSFALGSTASASICSDSKDSAQLARTAYNSSSKDKKKYLPSGYALKKIWNVKGEHAYLVTKSGNCHYTFRGLKKNLSIKAFFKLGQKKTCKTMRGKTLGKCIKNGYERYKKIRSVVLADIARRKCKGIRIHGHSMGGVLASLLAAELYKGNPRKYNKRYMKTYTYGSLRVFQSKDADKWNKRIRLYRWVYFKDHAPSYPSRGFKHFGRAYRIKKYRKIKILKFKAKWKYKYKKVSQNYANKTIFLDHAASHYTGGLKKCKL